MCFANQEGTLVHILALRRADFDKILWFCAIKSPFVFLLDTPFCIIMWYVFFWFPKQQNKSRNSPNISLQLHCFLLFFFTSFNLHYFQKCRPTMSSEPNRIKWLFFRSQKYYFSQTFLMEEAFGLCERCCRLWARQPSFQSPSIICPSVTVDVLPYCVLCAADFNFILLNKTALWCPH